MHLPPSGGDYVSLLHSPWGAGPCPVSEGDKIVFCLGLLRVLCVAVVLVGLLRNALGTHPCCRVMVAMTDSNSRGTILPVALLCLVLVLIWFVFCFVGLSVLLV